MVTFTFSVFHRRYPFAEYAEFSDGVHFFCFRQEIPFLDKFCLKNQNRHFRLIFGTETNSNMQNSMVVFTFAALDQKYPFWANLVQKIRIASLS